MTVIGIAVAGAVGALARYGLEGAVSNRWPGAFPWGTFVVNISGAFLIGLVFVLLTERVSVDPWVRSSITIGFLGAYTTFSTLSFESYRLLEDGADRPRARQHPRQPRGRARRRLPGRCRREGDLMRMEGEGKLLRVFVGESDTWHGRPLYEAIVARVREEGLAGATVVRGIEGFGAHSRIHSSRILRLSQDLPIVIELVDTAENIDRVLPILDEMVSEGMVTLERVEVIAYRAPAEDR